jgi:hypothetical protein
LAKGFDSDQIEILIVGNDIDIDYLAQLVKKAQKLIKKEIKTQVKSVQEFIREQENLLKESLLKVWTKSEP